VQRQRRRGKRDFRDMWIGFLDKGKWSMG